MINEGSKWHRVDKSTILIGTAILRRPFRVLSSSHAALHIQKMLIRPNMQGSSCLLAVFKWDLLIVM